MNSKLFTLNARDFIKGLIVAVITAVLMFLQTVLIDPSALDFKTILSRCGWAALAAAIAYLLKNLSTNSKDEFLTPEKE